MDIAFHYPPELLELLVETIPRLVKSKESVILFLRGAGVDSSLLADLEQQVRSAPQDISKFKIVRVVLARLNQRGEASLGPRREIVRRVTEFEDFSTCYQNDQLKAKGLVAEVRRVVNVKDSFTRMQQAEDTARRENIARREQEQGALAAKRQELESVNRELCKLFAVQNPQERGKMLEGVLNRLFAAHGVLVREAFERRNAEGDCLEQIDGVIEFDSHLYFVEMKWTAAATSRSDISNHLVRVYHRGSSRGLFISASGYSEAALDVSTESLQKIVFTLCTLQEFVLVLDRQADLAEFLRSKINAASIDKRPLHDVFGVL
jgi:restriction endonuclease Mrr